MIGQGKGGRAKSHRARDQLGGKKAKMEVEGQEAPEPVWL